MADPTFAPGWPSAADTREPCTDADLALSLPEIARLHAAEPFEWDVLAEIGRRFREAAPPCVQPEDLAAMLARRLADDLQALHDSGDCGRVVEALAVEANALARRLERSATQRARRPIDVTASLRELTPPERARVERYFAANLRPASPADVDDALNLVAALEQAGEARDARRLRAMVEEDAS